MSYFIFFWNELFIQGKVNTIKPKNIVSEDTEKDSLLFQTRMILDTHKSANSLIKALQKIPEVKFMSHRIGQPIVLEELEASQEEIIAEAKRNVVQLKGSYIYPVDLFAAVVFLQDKKNRLLQKYELTPKDLLQILYWTRRECEIDTLKDQELVFTGNGVFDSLIFGWSADVQKYSENFTTEVLHQDEPRIIGRSNEYDLLVTTLSKDTSSNALLIGEPGVGLATLVAFFAYESHRAAVPPVVCNKIVFKLLVDRLLSGVENQGQLEERFVELFSEIEHSGNIIVYIPNIENIFGGGGFNFDLTGVISDYLKSNKIKIIGSTNPQSYKTYIEKKSTLQGLMETIAVEDPDNETAIYMVMENIPRLEKGSPVRISYDAIVESTILASSYTPEGHMPSQAIHLLEDAVSMAKAHGLKAITKHEVRGLVEKKTHILLENPTDDEKTKLLHLEEDLHKLVISQEEAVKAVAVAMRRARSGMNKSNRPLSSFLFLGPTGVGKTETAKALAQLYFGSPEAMVRLDMSEYQTQDSLKRLLGGEGASSASLTDTVLANPFSLILLDEFEKAHPQILDVFLQILDDARLTDNLGRTVSFKNNIIIATSNAGSEFIREKVDSGVGIDELKKLLVENLLKNGNFRPELVNRFDDVIVFKPLDPDSVKKITAMMLASLSKKLADDKQLNISFDEKLIEMIATQSYSHDFGARNIRRFIEQNVEDILSQKILEGSIQKGIEVVVSTDESNSIVVLSK